MQSTTAAFASDTFQQQQHQSLPTNRYSNNIVQQFYLIVIRSHFDTQMYR